MIGNKIKKAMNLAERAHKNQFRKDGITPYIEHPKALFNLLLFFGIRDENILCSALLHDIIEDCGVKRKFIEEEFNSEVGRIVSGLTRDCPREEYEDRIKNSDFSIQIIKIADIIHNLIDLDKNYISIGTYERKINDCKNIYLDLTRKIYPFLFPVLNYYFVLAENCKGVKEKCLVEKI